MPVCETSDFPPAPFLCLMGRLLCWCGRKCRLATSCWALHWLQINVLLMFLPLLEFLLYFLCLCCSLYIHLWKRDIFFGKIITPIFWLQISPSVFLFFVTLFTVLPRPISFFASRSFHHFPKATLDPRTTFPYLSESFSIKEQTLAFLSPLLFCTI